MNRFALLAPLLALAAGCSTVNDGGGAAQTGIVLASITTVPSGVSCLRLVVTGSRVVDRSFAVVAGQSASINMMDLPTGSVTFNGYAYNTTCPTVGPMTVPTWISASANATLTAGQATSVPLLLEKNGDANVNITFADDDGGVGGSPDGGVGGSPDLGGGGTADLGGGGTADLGGGGGTADLGGGGTADLGSTPAMITASPTLYAFASRGIGSSSSNVVFTLRNNGGTTSGVPMVVLGGTNAGDFGLFANTCTVALAPAASCTVSAHFAPTSAGAKSASLSATFAPGGTVSIPFTGTGLSPAQLSVIPGALSFGNVTNGTASTASTLTVTNIGGLTTATFSGLTLTGANAGDFLVGTTTCTGTLAPAATCTTSVQFTPHSLGAKAATLTISAGSASVPAGLSGTGI